MAKAMTVHTFKLAFSQIKCAGCGVGRVRGIACADCGQQPAAWEINSALLARRQGVERTRMILSQTIEHHSNPGAIDAVEFLHARTFSNLYEWMTSFFHAATQAAEGSASGMQDLETSLREFIDLRSKILSADRRRPLRALGIIMDMLIGELESMVDSYLSALLATSPLTAQNLGITAQVHLDRSGAIATEASELIETISTMMRNGDTALRQSALLARTMELYRVSDLLALDSAGCETLHELVHSRGVPGSGVTFAAHETIARSVFDPDLFHNTFQKAYTLFHSNPSVLRDLANSPEFEEDFRSGVLELFDGSTEAMHAMENAVNSRQAGRSLLGISAALIEGPGHVLASALLLAGGRKSCAYKKLQDANATELVTMVQQEPKLQGLLDGLDCDLRTGRAHALVRYEKDFAEIVRKSKTRQISWPDVVDSIFHGYESVTACQLALLQVLGELGFTSFGIEGLWLGVGVSPAQAVITVLKSMNCWDITIQESAECWHISAHTSSEKPLPMMIAMLQPVIPPGIEHFEFTAWHAKDGKHVLRGPMSPWREFSTLPSSSDEHHIAFIRAQLQWTYNGAPWLPGPLIRRWVAGRASVAMELPSPASTIRELRVLRDLAVIAGDEALKSALSGAIRYVRLGNESQAGSELQQLLEWGSAQVTDPDWWQAY